MTREESMALFEKTCATWGFDFSKNSDGPNGLVYDSYETGMMHGMFDAGLEAGLELKNERTTNQ